ncbi:MAG: hypothetical protein LBP89_06430 [Helicobacteraceae bacterium]|nr:hypothetical protein [Helicobacteraceae bacterium]
MKPALYGISVALKRQSVKCGITQFAFLTLFVVLIRLTFTTLFNVSNGLNSIKRNKAF